MAKLHLTHEDSTLPVWDQILNNGSIRPNDVEISDASSLEDINDLDEGSVDDYFSDEENEPSDREDHNLRLRNYQEELAEIALTGRNSIICAPTGSGKTKVAIKIILEHLKQRPDAKIAFFARTLPLCKQQYQTIKNHLPTTKDILLITGRSDTSMKLHTLLPSYSVIVLTPMILVNHLCGRRPLLQEGITAFTLLVFDECHHTREEEPYNNIMNYYLKKKNSTGHRGLPQIVGLTASIGVEKAQFLEEAKDNIMGVCGNLDVDHVALVKRNVDELKKTVPVPKELQPRGLQIKMYEVTERILNIVKELEKCAKDFANEVHDDNINQLIGSVPADKKHPEYCQWVVQLRNAIKSTDIPDYRRETCMPIRNINIITDYLQAYHFALDAIDLAETHDVMKYLKRSFAKFASNPEKASQEERFYKMFTDLEEVLSRHANVNPNLEMLADLLRQYVVRRGVDSRGIVFVRTRMLAEALSSWLNRSGESDLKSLNAKVFTSPNAPVELGGMTEAGQETVLEQFRNGDVKVLMSTSVGEEGLDIAECNIVIKYNHIGNEVSKVQTRGRSRAVGGVSILLGMPYILERDSKNHRREKLMEQALNEISELSQTNFRQTVDKYQRALFTKWDDEEKEEEARRRRMRDVPFSVICHLCRNVAVQSNKVRTIYGKYRVSIDRNLLNHIKIYATEESKMDGLSFVGKAFCLGETEPGKICGNGFGYVITHMRIPFLTLGIKNIILQENGEAPKPYKQWKKVPYFVEELAHDDIMVYASAILQQEEGEQAANHE